MVAFVQDGFDVLLWGSWAEESEWNASEWNTHARTRVTRGKSESRGSTGLQGGTSTGAEARRGSGAESSVMGDARAAPGGTCERCDEDDGFNGSIGNETEGVMCEAMRDA